MLQSDLIYIAASLGFLYLCDRLVAQHGKRRWFMLHALGNGVVVVFSWHGTMASFGDPLHSMDSRVFQDSNALVGPTSKLPMSMITALHVYHIARFSVSHADQFHHCLFVPIIGLFGHVMAWGALRQFLAFFICGLPGAIDYVQLSCSTSEDARARQRRKFTTMMLNLCLRAPFLCFEACLHYVAFIHGTTTVHPLANATIAGLVMVNAMYYTYTSVRSYALASVPGVVSSAGA
jgi:hypothetical protein